MSYLLDTNTIIYAYKDFGGVRTHWSNVSLNDVALSTVSLFELEFGLAKSTNPGPFRIYLNALLERHRTLAFDATAAQHAGVLRASLQQAGTPIGPYDLLIASIALAHDLILVTRNTREFGRVPWLKLENWFD